MLNKEQSSLADPTSNCPGIDTIDSSLRARPDRFDRIPEFAAAPARSRHGCGSCRARNGGDAPRPSDASLGDAGLAFSSGSPLPDFATADTHLPSFNAAIEQRCGTHLPLTYSSAYSSPDMMTRRLHKHVPDTVNSPPRQLSASVLTQLPPPGCQPEAGGAGAGAAAQLTAVAHDVDGGLGSLRDGPEGGWQDSFRSYHPGACWWGTHIGRRRHGCRRCREPTSSAIAAAPTSPSGRSGRPAFPARESSRYRSAPGPAPIAKKANKMKLRQRQKNGSSSNPSPSQNMVDKIVSTKGLSQ